MDSHLLQIFQRELLNQCQYIVLSARLIALSLEERDTMKAMFAVQALLNANANVSKLCWGQKGRNGEQRKALRESVRLADDSVLREVNMRNNFEHIDDRLDTWWKDSARRNFADMMVGPRNLISGIDDIDTFRWFDPQTGEIKFWGQALNLFAILREVEMLMPRIEAELAKPPFSRG